MAKRTADVKDSYRLDASKARARGMRNYIIFDRRGNDISSAIVSYVLPLFELDPKTGFKVQKDHEIDANVVFSGETFGIPSPVAPFGVRFVGTYRDVNRRIKEHMLYIKQELERR